MPFTPFHFGVAALLKAAVPVRFSFLIFCYSQIVTDMTVAYNIVMREYPLHGFTHTFVGALVVGTVCGLTGPYVHNLAKRWNRRPSLMLQSPSSGVCFMSAFIGTFSHIVLDSVMHGDMQPLWPLSGANPILDCIPLDILHLACMAGGIVGLIWCGVRMRRSPPPRGV